MSCYTAHRSARAARVAISSSDYVEHSGPNATLCQREVIAID